MGLDVAFVLPVLMITGWGSPVLWGLIFVSQIWCLIYCSWSLARR